MTATPLTAAPRRRRRRPPAADLAGEAVRGRAGGQGGHAHRDPAADPPADVLDRADQLLHPGLHQHRRRPGARPARADAERLPADHLDGGVVARALLVSLAITAVGTAFSMVVTVLAAYGLSRAGARSGTATILWIMMITMFFNGGIIPLFLVVSALGGYDQYWALILPERGQRVQHHRDAGVLHRHRQRRHRERPDRRGGRLDASCGRSCCRRPSAVTAVDRAVLRGRVLELVVQRAAVHARGQRQVAAADGACTTTSPRA